MSNQRNGTWHKASASNTIADGQAMKLRNFFRDCKELLEQNDNENSAFYFEQIMDELTAGKPLPTERKHVSRLLGLCKLFRIKTKPQVQYLSGKKKDVT